MIGDEEWQCAGTPGSKIRFPGIPKRKPRALKLHDGRQKEIVVGDTDWQFPETLGSTIRFKSYNKGNKKRI